MPRLIVSAVTVLVFVIGCDRAPSDRALKRDFPRLKANMVAAVPNLTPLHPRHPNLSHRVVPANLGADIESIQERGSLVLFQVCVHSFAGSGVASGYAYSPGGALGNVVPNASAAVANADAMFLAHIEGGWYVYKHGF
ncbi:MAG: hypothetical protein AAF581_06365 [Planctomycetota bacterium]